ncbi:unnamed protein product [marine sediment metagenome]|uniref:Uncharacterized protein n=1 Tax=marine sediment metagenome TaxID=412755 RepID=X0TCG5_9ZZZZ
MGRQAERKREKISDLQSDAIIKSLYIKLTDLSLTTQQGWFLARYTNSVLKTSVEYIDNHILFCVAVLGRKNFVSVQGRSGRV